ncbi:MAG: SDR family oxidoreductase [Myxococcales bacterium FL481]|nr:MAG: SDR family oxidoreductase [Myxococcales bacterium FL481]
MPTKSLCSRSTPQARNHSVTAASNARRRGSTGKVEDGDISLETGPKGIVRSGLSFDKNSRRVRLDPPAASARRVVRYSVVVPAALSQPKKRVALVTGGAVRVGRAIVEHLVTADYAVWVHCYRSVQAAHELAVTLGDACRGVITADLGDDEARSRLCAQVLADNGELDLLVNNAASFEAGPVQLRQDADLRRVLETNLVAPIGLARRLAATLARRRGCIVNINDAAGYHPWREYLDHCTAKAGLLMATRALALELAPQVRVNGVAPGTVAWPTSPEYGPGSPRRAAVLRRIPLGQIGQPADIARAVLFLADEPHITGQTLPVDGGTLAACGR